MIGDIQRAGRLEEIDESEVEALGESSSIVSWIVEGWTGCGGGPKGTRLIIRTIAKTITIEQGDLPIG